MKPDTGFLGFGFVDRLGRPMNLRDWAIRRGEESYVRIALDRVRDFQISTAWLGTSHHTQPGAFLPFETVVFKSGRAVHCDRYETEDLARVGHRKLLVEYTERVSRKPRALSPAGPVGTQ